MSNPTFELMREAGLELSWENFLSVQYLGNPPSELDAEVAEELTSEYDAALLEELAITIEEDDDDC